MKSGPKPKQFCARGHDIFVVGRFLSRHCKSCTKEHSRKYYKLNPEKHTKRVFRTNRQWRKRNPGKIALFNLKHKTNRNLRIPKFGQKGIEEFYNNCLSGYEVDHIIPLQGKLVSVLHVIWNLQYLSKHENRVKKNKVV